MQLLIAFLVLCCIGGALLRRRSLALSQLLLFIGCVLVAIGYYFFEQI